MAGELKFNPEIREKILLEILNTERAYISDLNVILDVYYEPLKESGIITAEQAQILFSNVAELEALNRTKVLAKIEARFKAVANADVPAYMINMGDIFMTMADHLKVYTEYCANQPNALAMLDELERENPEFAGFTKDLMEKDEVVRGLSLLSFLIKPVQRLCKYPLLLRELINNTDESLPEHQRLKESADKVGETVDYVNAMQRQAEKSAAEKTQEIQQIEQSIEGAAEIELSADKNRRISDVTRSIKKKVVPRKLYLFNNLILLVAPRKKIKKGESQAFKIDWHAKIADSMLFDLANSEHDNITNGFEVKHKGTGDSAVLCCATLNEKHIWVKEIRNHIKEYQRKENARRKNLMILKGGSTEFSKSTAAKSPDSSNPGDDIPPPPPDDGATDWKEKQAAESTDPPGFVRPPRSGDWLQYHHEEYGIPYYYHIKTRETTWFQPEDDGYRLTYPGYDYLVLKTFSNRSSVTSIGRQIGVGKESDIYVVANDDNLELALKLHRLGRVSFRTVKNNRDYHQHRKNASWLYLSRLAALREYSYMKALHEAGFPVPRPYDHNRHGICMELIRGYSLVHVQNIRHVEKVYMDLMQLIVRLAEFGVVHGDFNEFNLMIDDNEKITVIDFPQVITVDHHNAQMYFERDVQCILTLFERKYGFTPRSDQIPSWKLSSQSRLGLAKNIRHTLGEFSPEQEQEFEKMIQAQRDGELETRDTDHQDAYDSNEVSIEGDEIENDNSTDEGQSDSDSSENLEANTNIGRNPLDFKSSGPDSDPVDKDDLTSEVSVDIALPESASPPESVLESDTPAKSSDEDDNENTQLDRESEIRLRQTIQKKVKQKLAHQERRRKGVKNTAKSKQKRELNRGLKADDW